MVAEGKAGALTLAPRWSWLLLCLSVPPETGWSVPSGSYICLSELCLGSKVMSTCFSLACVALLPEKAEGKSLGVLLLGSREVFDVLILAVLEACLFNNTKNYRLFVQDWICAFLKMCYECRSLSSKSFFPPFTKRKKNPLGYRREVPEVQNENDTGKVLVEAALFQGSHG